MEQLQKSQSEAIWFALEKAYISYFDLGIQEGEFIFLLHLSPISQLRSTKIRGWKCLDSKASLINRRIRQRRCPISKCSLLNHSFIGEENGNALNRWKKGPANQISRADKLASLCKKFLNISITGASTP